MPLIFLREIGVKVFHMLDEFKVSLPFHEELAAVFTMGHDLLKRSLKQLWSMIAEILV